MRLAMAQMHMAEDPQINLQQSCKMMEAAQAEGADLIFFPEIQLSPFFPARPGENADRWVLTLQSPEVKELRAMCRKLKLWASPNLYLEINGYRYDASLMIDAAGEIRGISKMVHIYQAENFYECDYYTPSDTGFRVYQTPFGKIGIVICFDRHIPGSIRSCAQAGADMVLVPTANLLTEPMELFEWEIRVQSFQNTVFVAMCNRTGAEDGLTFAGESMVSGPDGRLLFKADTAEKLYCSDIHLECLQEERSRRAWLTFS